MKFGRQIWDRGEGSQDKTRRQQENKIIMGGKAGKDTKINQQAPRV